MIKYLIEILRGNSIMEQVEADVREMFDQAGLLFEVSSAAVLEGKPVDFDIYHADRQINLFVVNTRKRIIEHLSVAPSTNPVTSMTLVVLINHIERIGDHAKNLYDLYRKLDGPMKDTPYLPRLKELRDKVAEMFDKAEKALFEDDDKKAKEVLNDHLEMVRLYTAMMNELLEEKKLTPRQAVSIAIVLRSLKRTSAHLKTISSSAVSPFVLMGYMQMPEVESMKSDAP